MKDWNTFAIPCDNSYILMTKDETRGQAFFHISMKPLRMLYFILNSALFII
jgi:hypothetical protein